MPKRLHEVLDGESKIRGKSVNQVILEDLRKSIWDRSRREKEGEKVEIVIKSMIVMGLVIYVIKSIIEMIIDGDGAEFLIKMILVGLINLFLFI